MSRPDGVYPAIIKDAYLNEDMRLCLDVDITDGSGGHGTCKHPTEGEYASAGMEVAKELGIEWPKGLADMSGLRDKTVEVNLYTKTKGDKSYQNWYIVTEEGKQYRNARADDSAVAAHIKKLANISNLSKENVPFYFKQSAGYRQGTGTQLDGQEHYNFPKVFLPLPSGHSLNLSP